jgi:hypothetical protein
MDGELTGVLDCREPAMSHGSHRFVAQLRVNIFCAKAN